jgi:hypothetical protein
VQRQVWIFLTEADAEDLIARLSAQVPLRRLGGRFFRGTAEDIRARADELETTELRKGERWTHLVHPTASRELVVHDVTEGPLAGWKRLDEVRSEVLTIVRPAPDPQGLGPGRLQANTHAWFGGARLRKSPEFSLWVADALRLAEAEYPSTAFDWLHVAPGARAFVKAGGTLHYLYKPVALAPTPGETPSTRPHGSN